jgi:pectate lyase
VQRAWLRAVLVAVAVVTAVSHSQAQRDVGRQVLAANDGFAALNGGVTGVAAAAEGFTFTVRTRGELVTALTDGPVGTPRIIYVDGVIDANVDDANRPLRCEDYYRGGYTLDAFLDFYNPSGAWGPNPPANTAGSLEAARLLSAAAQSARVRMRVPDNTTVLGAAPGASVRGAWFDLRGTATAKRRNIIIRNLILEDVVDCFPAWTPNRNANGTFAGTGAWDAEYDAVSLRDTENVWIDHNLFRDRTTLDASLPIIFGAKFQTHDGLLDITNASDMVTVSWNHFLDHDQTMLIGSSDSAPLDVGKLRVTLHHNRFENVGQRAPRVRYGQVHVYNNYYVIPESGSYNYSWGAGQQPTPAGSGIYAENNFSRTGPRFTPDRIVSSFAGGRAIFVAGTLQPGPATDVPIDPFAAYNAARDPDLSNNVGWAPVVYREFGATLSVIHIVEIHAGPFR